MVTTNFKSQEIVNSSIDTKPRIKIFSNFYLNYGAHFFKKIEIKYKGKSYKITIIFFYFWHFAIYHAKSRKPLFVTTSRDRPKSAPYPRLKNSKKTSKCQVIFLQYSEIENFSKKIVRKNYILKKMDRVAR